MRAFTNTGIHSLRTLEKNDFYIENYSLDDCMPYIMWIHDKKFAIYELIGKLRISERVTVVCEQP